jgi:hypothetical protein
MRWVDFKRNNRSSGETSPLCLPVPSSAVSFISARYFAKSRVWNPSLVIEEGSRVE